ncbi:SsrA-binding protein SmpB [Egicoccus halophilus]|uniref:SsrA-binding protein n=1 Tax=Egicoccus halophilus TaxID=1670830 RepID=A0A8J3EVE3_9ACTN|nr:SsrA-binding protein SmpB [Egicoccus halophilus]GGI09527.1 SsrA-binding protein [Egicoccus halophilus]
MAKTKQQQGKGDGTKLIVSNRRARFDYHLDDSYEAGLALVGTEVKSLRGGKGSLTEAWVKVDRDGQAWLMQAHIPEYEYGNRNNHDPVRPRKLLLHRRELERLRSAVETKGVSLVPTRLYFRSGRAKLEFAVGRGKNVADKRQTAAKRDAQREIERALKQRR